MPCPVKVASEQGDSIAKLAMARDDEPLASWLQVIRSTNN